MFDRVLNMPLTPFTISQKQRLHGARHRNSPRKVFLRKGIPKICSVFIGKQPCLSVISIKLLFNFFEITLQHGCSPDKFTAYSQNKFA